MSMTEDLLIRVNMTKEMLRIGNAMCALFTVSQIKL